MKKKILLALGIVAICLMVTSCNKSALCLCKYYDYGDYEGSEIIDTEEEGVKTCTQLEDRYNYRYGGDGEYFKCKKI